MLQVKFSIDGLCYATLASQTALICSEQKPPLEVETNFLRIHDHDHKKLIIYNYITCTWRKLFEHPSFDRERGG